MGTLDAIRGSTCWKRLSRRARMICSGSLVVHSSSLRALPGVSPGGAARSRWKREHGAHGRARGPHAERSGRASGLPHRARWRDAAWPQGGHGGVQDSVRAAASKWLAVCQPRRFTDECGRGLHRGGAPATRRVAARARCTLVRACDFGNWRGRCTHRKRRQGDPSAAR